MAVEKKVLSPPTSSERPRKGDMVTIEYTGYIRDDHNEGGDFKGRKFDSSVNRGPFSTKIGIGQVIQGWDEGILGTGSGDGMALGEKATLFITSDYGYGERGFPDYIPPNANLVFDVELKAINGTRA